MTLIEKLKLKAKALRVEITAIYLSLKSRRTPLFAKIVILLTISYAVSPIDLIPDFIPVLGYLDDLIIVPLLITLSVKLIPKDVMHECRISARTNVQLNKKMGIYAAFCIVLFWIVMVIYLSSYIIKLFVK